MHFNDLIISDNPFSAKCSIFSYCNLKTNNKEVTFLFIPISVNVIDSLTTRNTQVSSNKAIKMK